MEMKYTAGKFISGYDAKKFVRREFRVIEQTQDIDMLAPVFDLHKKARYIANGTRTLKSLYEAMNNGGLVEDDIGYCIVLGLCKIVSNSEAVLPEVIESHPDNEKIVSEMQMVLEDGRKIRVVEGVECGRKGIYIEIVKGDEEEKILIASCKLKPDKLLQY